MHKRRKKKAIKNAHFTPAALEVMWEVRSMRDDEEVIFLTLNPNLNLNPRLLPDALLGISISINCRPIHL